MDQRKPHVWRGRFYNNAHDSIFARMLNTGRVVWMLCKYWLAGRRKKNVLLESKSLAAELFVQQQFENQSIQPTVTWLGHASFLIQMVGLNIITDPVFFTKSSLVSRYFPSPVRPEQLPPIDIVLISHNHWDHMDEKSLLALKRYQPTIFVPMGNKQWFVKRGFLRVRELSWWEDAVIHRSAQPIAVTFLPAEHWSGRSFFNINKSLWGSWMISCNEQHIYFAGDTAYADHFTAIKNKFPNIHVALMPIGPKEPRRLLAEAHLGPEEAVKAFIELDAQHFIPMHWATFMFGLDSFFLPIKRLQIHWDAYVDQLMGKTLHMVKCGEQRTFQTKSQQSKDAECSTLL